MANGLSGYQKNRDRQIDRNGGIMNSCKHILFTLIFLLFFFQFLHSQTEPAPCNDSLMGLFPQFEFVYEESLKASVRYCFGQSDYLSDSCVFILDSVEVPIYHFESGSSKGR
ncbi:hypothetical protein JXI42_00960 [bacterium]|nr:hypothetical protein [bacterium]